MGHIKANKLVGLFHNLRLIKKMRNLNYTETCVGWNEEDDKTGLVKYGVTHYEPPVPRKDWRITTPARPAVTFHNNPEPLLEDALPLLLDQAPGAEQEGLPDAEELEDSVSVEQEYSE